LGPSFSCFPPWSARLITFVLFNFSKSCTVVLEESIICVRDGGTWYNCPGGYEVSDFVRQICEAYSGPNPPAACNKYLKF